MKMILPIAVATVLAGSVAAQPIPAERTAAISCQRDGEICITTRYNVELLLDGWNSLVEEIGRMRARGCK